MAKKILWIDTETTGVIPVIHSMIQIAGIIDIDGVEIEKFAMNVQPHPDFEIDERSEKIHGISVDEMQAFPTMTQTYNELLKLFAKHINKFDKNDKFIIAGKNISFDLDVLSQFFTRMGDTYLGSWIDFRRRIEVEDIVNAICSLGFINPESKKLQALCSLFGIPLADAHSALCDIVSTRELYYAIVNSIDWNFVKQKSKKLLRS